MLDKFLHRVRSWLHIDPVHAPGSSGGAATMTTPMMSSASATAPAHARTSIRPDLVPPPPAEAYSLTMEAQPESGMVITESGIIIIDPASAEARTAQSAEFDSPRTGPPANDASWALPVFSKTPPSLGAATSILAATSSSAGNGDWDTVLARARERLVNEPAGKKPGK